MYDIVVIDEAQDQARSLYLIVRKLLHDSGPACRPTLLVVGDVRQCIYQARACRQC